MQFNHPATNVSRMKVLVVSFLVLFLRCGRVTAFAPLPSSMTTQARAGISPALMSSLLEDNDKDPKEQVKGKQDKGVASALGAPRNGLTLIQKAFCVITDVASYGIMTICASLTFSLILSMFGLSYQVSWNHGLEIETIGKMREIKQFRAAVNSRPPSALPK